jgi:hypothetical protein
MSIPNKARKYGDKVVIEPARASKAHAYQHQEMEETMFVMNPTDRAIDFEKSAPEGPVIMVNLMKLKEGVDLAEFVTEMGGMIHSTLSELGAERVFTGIAGPEFCAEDDWDIVALVKYPNYQSFLKLMTDEAWIATAGQYREDALSDARMILTQAPV